MDRLTVTCVVENNEGKILTVSRGANLNDWNLPGGKVEEHESLREAAVRELLEETGLDAEELHLVFSMPVDDGSTCTTFVITKFSGELRSSEEGQARWKHWSDILTTNNSFHQYNRDLYNFYKMANNVFSDS